MTRSYQATWSGDELKMNSHNFFDRGGHVSNRPEGDWEASELDALREFKIRREDHCDSLNKRIIELEGEIAERFESIGICNDSIEEMEEQMNVANDLLKVEETIKEDRDKVFSAGRDYQNEKTIEFLGSKIDLYKNNGWPLIVEELQTIVAMLTVSRMKIDPEEDNNE